MRWLVLSLFLLARPALADVIQFETPSGNIQCSVGLGADFSDISCDIIDRSGPPALPRPDSCTGTWGHRFTMLETGPVQVECTAPPQALRIPEKAPYGVAGTWGDISCLSETTGLTCRNADGRGFFLSRQSQLVF